MNRGRVRGRGYTVILLSKIAFLIFCFLLAVIGKISHADLTAPETSVDLTPEEESILIENTKHPVPEKFKGISSQSSLNFLIPSREGYGDVVSNLQMLDLLKKKYPGIKVNVIYEVSSKEKLSKLVQRFDSHKSIQSVDGTLFWEFGVEKLPSADIVLSFSSRDKFFYKEKVLKTAPVAVCFTEFGDFDYAAVRRQNPQSLDHFYPGTEAQKVGSNAYLLNSGAGSAGFYISVEKPPKKMSAADLIKALREIPGTQVVGKVATIDANTEIGFTYTNRSQPSVEYINALSKRAHADPNRAFVAFVNSNYALEFEKLAPNLQLIIVRNMPYELSKECVANATLPIMVTGDGSLNLAIEYEKPFLYETNYWKQVSVRSLRQSLASTKSFRDDKSSYELLKQALPATAKSPQKPAFPNESEIFQALSDARFQRRFKSALRQSRLQNVLSGNLDKIFNFLSSESNISEAKWKKFVNSTFKPQPNLGCEVYLLDTLKQIRTPIQVPK